MIEEVHGTPLERLRREVGELRTKLLEIDRIVGDLEIPGDAVESSAPPPSTLDLQGAARAIRSLIQGRDQAGILERLLEETTRYSDRAALFLEEDQGGYRVWRVQGFASSGWERTEISREDPLLESIRQQEILEFDLASGEPPRWMQELEGRGKAVLFPISFGSRAPVLLYADGSPQPEIDPLELLVETSRLVLQNQYLAQMVQVQEQGGPLPSRWPALESLGGGKLSSAEEPTSQPTSAGPPAEQIAGGTPLPGTEQMPAEVAEEAGEFQPSQESRPAEQFQSLDETSPTEQTVASPEQAEGPVEEPPTEQPVEPPPGESTWAIESKADLKPEDLGLSQDEFDRLMGQASTDWLEVQKARHQAGLEIPREEPERAQTESSAPGAETEERSVEETERETSRTETREAMREEGVPAETPTGPEEVPGGEAAAVSPAVETEEETAQQKQPEEESVQEAAPEVVKESEDATSPEEVLHGEARRFARLLVAEIKLYNEPEVEAGRQNGDLYSRLKTDIDRSREMYERRVHPSVKASMDYFHAQLVQMLAQNDEEVMGEDYPGPQVAENA